MFAGSNPSSDILTILKSIGAYAAEYNKRNLKSMETFCKDNFLNFKLMQEIHKLRLQLTLMFNKTPQFSIFRKKNISVDPGMAPPNAKQQLLIRQVLLSGFGDQIAKLNETSMSGHGKNALPVYETLWCSKEEEFVIHPSSVIYRIRPAPKYILYDQVVGKEERFTSDGKEGVVKGNQNKYWLKGITIIDESWIAKQPSPLCNHGKLLTQPEPKYNVTLDRIVGYTYPTYGPKLWQLPLCEQNLECDSHIHFAKSLLEGKVGEPNESIFSILNV